MRLKSGYEERKVRMEMLPLMDVMFLLLLMFVYSSFAMAVHRGVKVALPSVSGPLFQGERIIITLTAENEFSLEGEPMALGDVAQATINLWHQENRPVLISADRAAALGNAIELLGKLRQGGVEQVAFQVDGKRDEPAANRKISPTQEM